MNPLGYYYVKNQNFWNKKYDGFWQLLKLIKITRTSRLKNFRLFHVLFAQCSTVDIAQSSLIVWLLIFTTSLYFLLLALRHQVQPRVLQGYSEEKQFVVCNLLNLLSDDKAPNSFPGPGPLPASFHCAYGQTELEER